MASEIRVNKIENRSGLGTVTFADTGVDLAGIVTATTFSGSGASLTSLPAAQLTGALPAISGANLTGIAATDNVRTGILDVAGVGTFRGDVNIPDKIIHLGDTDTAIRFPSADTIQLETAGSERFRIESGKSYFVGNTSGGFNSSSLPNGNTININTKVSNDGVSVIRYSSSYGPYGLNIGRSKSDTLGTNTLVANGDDLGHITWYGADGSDFNQAAAITAQVDGSPSDGTDMPGRILFKTTSDGSGTVSERMRLTSNGRLLIGRTSASSYDNLLQIKSITVETDADATGMQFNRTDSNAAWVAMRFRVQGNQSGYIQVNTSSVTYSTSSDYRLKENVVSISDGITRLKQLKPYRFNFKNDSSTTLDGFYAHEASEVVPESVVGKKDAVDAEGNIDPQGIDQSKLVPLLTAALQEAVAKIEVLEAKVAALEGS